MNGTTFIGIMTFANFILLLGLAYYILKGKQSGEHRSHNEEAAFAQFLQDKLEPEPVTTIEQILAPVSRVEEQLDGRSLAVKRLKLGEDPEEVASDLGFSRSEIGILQAAARR
jgi:hypothetical protein